jgi:divalent metal cation (Fe/Co/Zn/Cd) transporter
MVQLATNSAFVSRVQITINAMTVLPIAPPADPASRTHLLLLQAVTLAWMLVECAVSLVASARAHSPALLAFGFDSFVELLSAALVVLALAPRFHVNRRPINRASGVLLFVLAAAVAVTALLAWAGKVHPESSLLGIVITVAALLVMPLLAWQKRKLARRSRNNALAADAVQSATCAYLALITLAGLALNAALHAGWADSVAALAAVPILILEGRRAMRGQSCGCC